MAKEASIITLLEGGSSPYRHTYYMYDSGPPMGKEDRKLASITLAVLVGVILLLRFLCFCVRDQRCCGREEQDAGGGDRARQQFRRPPRGRDRDPTTMAADSGVEVVSVQAAAAEPPPPLVCTYRKADGWQDEDATCWVCLAELADGDDLRVLPECMHYFHADCVGEWLRSNKTCPLCRAPLLRPAPPQHGDHRRSSPLGHYFV